MPGTPYAVLANALAFGVGCERVQHLLTRGIALDRDDLNGEPFLAEPRKRIVAELAVFRRLVGGQVGAEPVDDFELPELVLIPVVIDRRKRADAGDCAAGYQAGQLRQAFENILSLRLERFHLVLEALDARQQRCSDAPDAAG